MAPSTTDMVAVTSADELILGEVDAKNVAESVAVDE